MYIIFRFGLENFFGDVSYFFFFVSGMLKFRVNLGYLSDRRLAFFFFYDINLDLVICYLFGIMEESVVL